MMGKKLRKVIALVAIGGMAFGCLSFPCCPCKGLNACTIFTGLLTSAAGEFLWDNDAVFDLFQDDFGTGTQYDDRFTAAPTRAEPEGANVNNLGAGN